MQYTWKYGGDWAPYSAGATDAASAPGAGLSLPVVVMHDPNQISLGQLGSSPFPAQLLTDARTPDGWVHYTYDRLGQLTAGQYSADGPVQPDESYRYDANGNRANWGNAIGPKNRLLSDGLYKYEYDAEGNRTRRTSIATGALTEYTWDARNRLAVVTDYAAEGGAATHVVTFLYDVGNRWIGEDVDRDADGVVDHQTRFAYDGEQIVLAFDKEDASEITAADLSHRYLWRPAVDQLLADERVHARVNADAAVDDVLWALTDHLGSLRDQARLVETTTKVVNHVVFGSFGEVLSESDPAEGSLFGFTGRPESEATGLRNHWQRWADPGTGDWMSEDPLGFAAGDTNTRRYVGNAPTVFVDPTGLWIDRGNNHWEAEGDDDFYSLVTLVDPNLAPHKNAMCIRPVDPQDPEVEDWMRDAWGDVNRTGDVPAPFPGAEYDVSNLVARRNPNADPIADALRVSVGGDRNGYIAAAQTFFGAINRTGAEVAEILRVASGSGQTPVGSLIIIGHCHAGGQTVGGRGENVPGGNARFGLRNLFVAGRDAVPTPNRPFIYDAANTVAYWPTFDEALAWQLPPVAWLTTDAVVYLVGCQTATFAHTIADQWLRSNQAVAWGTLRDTWAMGGMGWATRDGRQGGHSLPVAFTPQDYLPPGLHTRIVTPAARQWNEFWPRRGRPPLPNQVVVVGAVPLWAAYHGVVR